MKDSLRRAIRTFVQAFTGVILLQAGAVGLDIANGEFVPDIDWLKRVGLAATVAGAIALVTWLHNATEDKGVIPSVLKATASSGANPVTHDAAR